MTAIDDRPARTEPKSPEPDWSQLEIECAPPEPKPTVTLEELIALQNRIIAERRAREYRASMAQLERERQAVFEEYYCYCSPSRGARFRSEPPRRTRRRVSPVATYLTLVMSICAIALAVHVLAVM